MPFSPPTHYVRSRREVRRGFLVCFSRYFPINRINDSMGTGHSWITKLLCPKGLGLFLFAVLRPVECGAYSSGVSEKK